MKKGSWLSKGLYYLFSITFGVLLAIFISDRSKRLIAASSFYAYMDNFKTSKLNDIDLMIYVDHIDDILKISCESTRAMMFPVFIQQYIWGRLDQSRLINFATRESAIKYANEKLPWFMRYDTRVFARDVVCILKEHDTKFLRLESEHREDKLLPSL